MKISKLLLRLLAFLLIVIQTFGQAQISESLRAQKWLSLQKLLFKQSSASWSLTASDVNQIKDLQGISLLVKCTSVTPGSCRYSVLPVAGLILKGQRTNTTKVSLQWETTAEYNSKGFVLERQSMINGNVFDSIYYTEGAGTTYSKSKYQFTDPNNFHNSSFYRVRQVDRDGNYTYSNIVEISGVENEFAVNITPNPAKSSNLRLYFTVPSLSQAIDFTIFNALGNPVIKKEKFVATTGYYEMKNKYFPPGYYFITVQTGTAVYSKSFVISN